MLASEEWAAERLGYRFRDPALLDAALTHRSAATSNYERLEFLGDAVLNFAVADLVFRAFPDAPEGDLSRYRSALVSGRFLAEAAGRLGLGEQLRLGSGELKYIFVGRPLLRHPVQLGRGPVDSGDALAGSLGCCAGEMKSWP